MESSAEFVEALAVGLGRLEEGLVEVAARSKYPDCPGPVGPVCRCPEARYYYCLAPIVFPQVEAAAVAEAVRTVWPSLVARAVELDLRAQTVGDLNLELRLAAGLPGGWEFVDQGFPDSWPGLDDSDASWSGVLDYFRLTDEEWQDDPADAAQWFDEKGCYVVSVLTWGQHLPALGLTTGWLLASAMRLAKGLDACAPTKIDRVLDALDAVRPGIWDGEDMRGLWPDRV